MDRLPHAPHPGPLPELRGKRGTRDGGTVKGNSWGQIADRVLYRDGLIIVIDKPARIAVHPGPGGGPNLESRFDELRFGLPHPPALAHRLDRDTSGCLVLGRHPKALRRLGALFADGKVEKVYWAVVEGEPARDRGTDRDRPQKAQSRQWLAHDRRSRRTTGDHRLPGSAVPRMVAPGSNCDRIPAEPISCGSIAPSSAAPSSVTVYTEMAQALNRLCFTRARSLCRSTRRGRPWKSPLRSRPIWPRPFGGWATKRPRRHDPALQPAGNDENLVA